MTDKEFKEAIDFALAREEDAVAFYTDLQEHARFQEQKGMLGELADMERGHIALLQKIKTDQKVRPLTHKPEDLHISEYLVVPPKSEDLSYQDILILAMKREEASRNLYRALGDLYSGSELEQVFRRLEAEEGDHKLRFEKLYEAQVMQDN